MVSLQLMLLAAALTGNGNTQLLAFTSDTCGPCRLMQPILHRMQESGYPIRLVNVDREPELAQRFGVRPIPCFVLIRDGREVSRLVGAASYDRLVQMWDHPAQGPQAPDAPAADAGTAGMRAQSPDDGSTPAMERLAPGQVPAIHREPLATDPLISSQNSRPADSATNLSIQQRALQATVHLRVVDRTGQSCGTGTIIDTHGDEALILTCGHIFRASQGQGDISVELFAPGAAQPVRGQLVAYEADSRDVGLVSIRPNVPVRPMRVASTRYRPQQGESVFSVGCDHGAAPTVRESRISAVDRYLGPPNLEIYGSPVEGRSGGGLFTADGRLIGVCNAADREEDRGIFAGLSSIHYELKSINQERIYLGDEIVSAAPPGEIPAAGGMSAVVPEVPLRNINLPMPDPSASAAPEMVCILRFRDPAGSADRVLIVDNPSAALVQSLEREARVIPSGSRPTADARDVPVENSTSALTAAAPILRAQNR